MARYDPDSPTVSPMTWHDPDPTVTDAPDVDRLRGALERLDGKSYGAYKEVKGAWDLGHCVLHVDYVQGDPFARPSRVRAAFPPAAAELPEWTRSTRDRRRATADFLNRALARAFRTRSRSLGSGRSGELEVLRPGQEVLERTSVLVQPDGEVELRFGVGLPARGRRILGLAAAELLCDELPEALAGTIPFPVLDADALREQVESVEDAVALRAQLAEAGLVAFVADGATLPRRSGIDDRPLKASSTVPFEAPESLRVALDTPNAGPIRGLGIRTGVTLIVGGGYHGKSTVLRAIERGVYDHPPGDGRERVVTLPDAVKVRAEDGRRVAGVDISNFIDDLPNGQDTADFWTENASGSTSQAAAIAEALEIGTSCLLIDEDTSATNFMIRDARMQALVSDRREPITPLIDRARQLADDEGISLVLVVGGSGDYFDVADTVVEMHAYLPEEVTDRARAIAADRPSGRAAEARPWAPVRHRVPDADSIDASKGRRAKDIRVRARDRVTFGGSEVDLAALEQLTESGQTDAIANAATLLAAYLGGGATLSGAVSALMERIAVDGLGIIHPEPIGDFSAFRAHELAAFLNRLRTLEMDPG